MTERLIYVDTATASSSQNLAVSDGHNALGQLIYHLDPAGAVRTDSFSLAGKPLAQTRQLLANDNIQVDWPVFQNLSELSDVSPTAYCTQWQRDTTGEIIVQWDARGNRQRLSYTTAGQLKESWLQQKDLSEQSIVGQIRYSAAGQILTETAGNGVVTAYSYEPQTQRLIRIYSSRPLKEDRATVFQDLQYDYDPVGNILSIDDQTQQTKYYANQKTSAQRHYTYDTLYQLITATGREDAKAGVQTQALPPLKTPLPEAADGQLVNYQRDYQYDCGGNLIQIKHQGAKCYTRTIEISERSNRAAFVSLEANGRVLPRTSQPFDDRGNLLALSTGQTLRWDARNQLSQAIMIKRAEGSADDEEHYRYGSDGMRVSKTTTTQGASGLQQDKVIYLPGLELRTLNNEKEKLDVILIGEAGRCQVRVLHWGKEKPQSIENDQLRYSLDDQVGSSLMELDGDTDKLSEEVYYPYGGTALWAAKSAVETKYKYVRYSGKERDATGLYYYGYRYYIPSIGRWLNPDPAGTVDGLNVFKMVENNPVSLKDILGLSENIYLVYGFDQQRDKYFEASTGRQNDILLTIDHMNAALEITSESFDEPKKLLSRIEKGIQVQQNHIDSLLKAASSLSEHKAEQLLKGWSDFLQKNYAEISLQKGLSKKQGKYGEFYKPVFISKNWCELQTNKNEILISFISSNFSSLVSD